MNALNKSRCYQCNCESSPLSRLTSFFSSPCQECGHPQDQHYKSTSSHNKIVQYIKTSGQCSCAVTQSFPNFTLISTDEDDPPPPCNCQIFYPKSISKILKGLEGVPVQNHTDQLDKLVCSYCSHLLKQHKSGPSTTTTKVPVLAMHAKLPSVTHLSLQYFGDRIRAVMLSCNKKLITHLYYGEQVKTSAESLKSPEPASTFRKLFRKRSQEVFEPPPAKRSKKMIRLSDARGVGEIYKVMNQKMSGEGLYESERVLTCMTCNDDYIAVGTEYGALLLFTEDQLISSFTDERVTEKVTQILLKLQTLIALYNSSQLGLWNISDTTLFHLRTINLHLASLSYTGQYLVLCSEKSTSFNCFTDFKQDPLSVIRNVDADFGRVLSVTWNPTDDLIAMGTDGDLILIYSITSQLHIPRATQNKRSGILAFYAPSVPRPICGVQVVEHSVCEGHDSFIQCIHFQGKWLISGGRDGKIVFWDTEDHGQVLSPSSSYRIVSNSKTIKPVEMCVIDRILFVLFKDKQTNNEVQLTSYQLPDKYFLE